MEIKDFSYFVDREKGRPCLVAGNGPSIGDFPFDRFKGVKVFMGSAPYCLKKLAVPDYWVNANHTFPVPQKHLRLINSMPDHTFIFSDTACYFSKNIYDHNFLEKNLKIKWFAFDERHFNFHKCNPQQGCCQLLEQYPGRITLQEYLSRHFHDQVFHRLPGTTVFHSFAFALLMGCSPIYLDGIEIPMYMKDHYYHNTFHSLQKMRQTFRAFRALLKDWFFNIKTLSAFAQNMDNTLADFQRLIEIAQQRGVEVFNLSSTSSLNRIKILPYLDSEKAAKL